MVHVKILQGFWLHGAESFLRSWWFLKESSSFTHFMEPEGPLLCSHLTILPRPDADELSPHYAILFL